MGIKKMVKEALKEKGIKKVPKEGLKIYSNPTTRTDSSCNLSDKDLEPVKEMLQKEELQSIPERILQTVSSIKLAPEVIKTLPVGVLTSLIEERRGELKQLKIELIARII